MSDDLDPLERHLLAALANLEPGAEVPAPSPDATAVWRAQLDSRHCDFAARWLQQEGRSFYTIGSAGHESNAAVALALRPSDPALLHYRSGAFYLARARQTGRDGVPDILLGVTAASDEPIAGGRHKVFGHHELAIMPQTSTIASHLPRAVGVAIAIDRARKLGVDCAWPLDAVVVCSFGDASINHATAQSALNTAAHAAHQHLPVPLFLVCEDNGLGISVPTPAGWAEEALRARVQLRYEHAAGDDPARVLETARELATWVRATRRPAVLHLRTVRLSQPCRCRRRVGLSPGPGDPGRLASATRFSPPPDGSSGQKASRSRSRRGLPDDARARAPGCTRRRTAPATRVRRGRHATARPTLGRARRHSRRGITVARREPADARAGHQRGARRRARAYARASRLRRGRGGEGRRLRRHPWPACAVRRRARVRHPARRDSRFSDWRSGRRSPASCRYPRSSTSPTCTTPRTSCAARRRHCSSSPRANTGTAWSCGSPGTATRRASAATSTTTTPSGCSATSPGS